MNSRHSLVESVALQLHSWKPFQIQTLGVDPSKSYPFHAKKPCRSDRSTAPRAAADALDLSKLTLLEDPTPPPPPPHHKPRDERLRWLTARKRRRRGSRSVSGRSSDRSAPRRLGCGGGGASAAYATCSDFPLPAGGTDSSGELFANGDGGSWCSDVSEARIPRRGEGKELGGGGGGEGALEREASAFAAIQLVVGVGGGAAASESQGNESGYGSEPGYRGDGELGYGDELDEEEDDGRLLFWGEHIEDIDRMEIVGENEFAEQKSHHRCRRRKHDWRMTAPLR
ncbi:hypothetical protein ACMD2_12483 [Ananas comosus]|uniref:Uncharacterized protein n=1 Tax=Ananas comosus TaxID=4615 RepID=A0A199UGB2_ANACO|nr:hypothetical protein ACMD2_12483 [Ananas comosus]